MSTECVAEMQNACRNEVHSGIFKVLVQRIVFTVANDGIGDGARIRYIVVRIPANFVQWIKAAALVRRCWREHQNALSNASSPTRGKVKVLTLDVEDERALAPLE